MVMSVSHDIGREGTPDSAGLPDRLLDRRRWVERARQGPELDGAQCTDPPAPVDARHSELRASGCFDKTYAGIRKLIFV
jgi:hypothetical protein